MITKHTPLAFVADWSSRTVNSESCGDCSPGWVDNLARWCRVDGQQFGFSPAELDHAAALLSQGRHDLEGYIQAECRRFAGWAVPLMPGPGAPPEWNDPLRINSAGFLNRWLDQSGYAGTCEAPTRAEGDVPGRSA